MVREVLLVFKPLQLERSSNLGYLSVRDGRIESASKFIGRKLTPKMLSFINCYFGSANFNACEAVRQSDYKNGNDNATQTLAAELMNHPLVQAEVKRRLDAREAKSEVKAEFLIQKLMEIISQTQENNPTAALRAIELAGKSIALWKERQEISGPDGDAIKHEQHIKESVSDFTTRLNAIASKPSGNPREAKRDGSTNVVDFPERSGTS